MHYACFVFQLQLDQLRKKVATLEQAIEAKDRENVTSRAMYDNMKVVSRRIKEVRAEMYPPNCRFCPLGPVPARGLTVGLDACFYVRSLASKFCCVVLMLI